jgi:hypothetical protein
LGIEGAVAPVAPVWDPIVGIELDMEVIGPGVPLGEPEMTMLEYVEGEAMAMGADAVDPAVDEIFEVVVDELLVTVDEEDVSLVEPVPDDFAACLAAKPGMGSSSFFLVVVDPVLVGAAPELVEEAVAADPAFGVLWLVDKAFADEEAPDIDEAFPVVEGEVPPMAAAKDEVLA